MGAVQHFVALRAAQAGLLRCGAFHCGAQKLRQRVLSRPDRAAEQVAVVQLSAREHSGEPLLERIVAEKGSEIHAPSSVPQNLLQYIIP